MIGRRAHRLRRFTGLVAAAGYTGDVEVEIFNADLWAADGDTALATVARRYVELVEPSTL